MKNFMVSRARVISELKQLKELGVIISKKTMQLAKDIPTIQEYSKTMNDSDIADLLINLG